MSTTINLQLTPKQAVELISATTIADMYDIDDSLRETTDDIRKQIREESTKDDQFNEKFSAEVLNFKK